MGWLTRIKLAEFGIGLGVAAFLGWSLLGLAFMLPLLELDLEKGAVATRLLVATCQDLPLLLAMLLAGMLAGALLLTGRWIVGTTAALIAAAFRAGLLLATGEPDAPWLDWLQVGVHLVLLGLSVPVFAWGFGLMARIGKRGQAKKDKAG